MSNAKSIISAHRAPINTPSVIAAYFTVKL